MSGRTMRWAAAGGGSPRRLGLGTGVAWAAPEGRIQQVESVDGAVTYVLSAEGLAEGESIDPASVRDDARRRRRRRPRPRPWQRGRPGRRRAPTMIVLDSSGSMADNDKLAKAQDAAKQYLATLPADVKAGLVTFADKATVEVAPTEDRAAVVAAIDELEGQGRHRPQRRGRARRSTQLGDEGSRNAVLLSDGEDEGSDTSAKKRGEDPEEVRGRARRRLAGTGKQTAQLAAFAKAGNGSVVTATDAGELTAAFESAARSVVTPAGRHRPGPRGRRGGHLGDGRRQRWSATCRSPTARWP